MLRQNTLLNKFEAVLNKLNDMERKINLLESKINTVGTSYTSDRLRIEMMNFEKYQQDNFNTFKNEMYSYVTNWKGYIG